VTRRGTAARRIDHVAGRGGEMARIRIPLRRERRRAALACTDAELARWDGIIARMAAPSGPMTLRPERTDREFT